jgi:hypothetical protein
MKQEIEAMKKEGCSNAVRAGSGGLWLISHIRL